MCELLRSSKLDAQIRYSSEVTYVRAFAIVFKIWYWYWYFVLINWRKRNHFWMNVLILKIIINENLVIDIDRRFYSSIFWELNSEKRSEAETSVWYPGQRISYSGKVISSRLQRKSIFIWRCFVQETLLTWSIETIGHLTHFLSLVKVTFLVFKEIRFQVSSANGRSPFKITLALKNTYPWGYVF